MSFEYFVKFGGKTVKVCKAEFLSVYGLHKSKRRVELLCKTMVRTGSTSPGNDNRGKQYPNTEVIIAVIKILTKYTSTMI